jgi:hypothetical protein
MPPRLHFVLRQTPQTRVLWIAAFAAFLHALLPTLHQLSAREQLQAVCVLGGQITLVAIDTTAGPAEQDQRDSPAHKTQECPLCLVGAHLADAPPAQLLPFARVKLPFIAPLTRVPVTRENRRALAFSSRAPPTSS